MTIKAGLTPAFLQGGGDMGERMRSKDWSTTELGSPDTWPQSLRTAVNIILNSQFPMFVWWGKEQATLYNDAYRIIAGEKHPGLLGQPGREAWAEIWGDLLPLVENVSNGHSTWSEDQLLYVNRHGYVEETYFTFSYSPVIEETGTVAGLFCACIETTSAQFKLNTKTISAVTKAGKAVVFSDEDASAYAKEAVLWMDTHNEVAGPEDPYTRRLNKIFGAHLHEDGLPLNFKVYKVTDINAFACADGSVRVFSALMDIMTDEELLAIIGHEIGHVRNHDSRDALKAAYTRAAGKDLAASQSGVAAALTDGELGAMAEGLMSSNHSRKQESEADDYSYEFLKKHHYSVMGAYTAFMKLAKMEGGSQQNKMQKMFNSHPDSKKRAEEIEKRAKKDLLWKDPA